MYIDDVVIAGIVTVLATCVVLGYATKHIIQHVRKEVKKTEDSSASNQ
jgi:hypothetical protein